MTLLGIVLRQAVTALLALAFISQNAVAAASPQPAASARDSLTATERALVRAVDAKNAEALALLERLVNINSGTMNFAGVREVGAVLRAELDALGFTTRWVDGAPFKRAGHLVAEHKGPGPKLLLIGHLDTVFEPSSPFQKFERLSDSTARGPGITDMKGGDVIIVYALKALKATGALDQMNIVIVMTGDEEQSGEPLELARRPLVDAAKGAYAALGFEDGSGDPRTAVISRRSSSSWELRSTGTPAHSSQIFTDKVGAGAIFESARVLQEFRQRLSGEQYLTFNPGVALGGTTTTYDPPQSSGTAFGKDNVVAETMIVGGDIRALSPEQLAKAKRTMQEIVAAHLPQTKSEITFFDGYPPMAPTPGNRKLLAMHDSTSRDLGYGPIVAVDPSKAGAADVSFTAGHVSMAIDALGLAGRDGHTVKETADIKMLAPLTKRAAVLLYRLSRSAQPGARPIP
jgi:glutamate carboxypeptidase